MYRESLLGVAFAATLSELSETHHLSEPQRSNLWAVFDRVMDGCLAETPPMTRVVVRTPVDEYPSANTRKWQQESTNVEIPMEKTRLITEEKDEARNDNVINISAERSEQNSDDNLTTNNKIKVNNVNDNDNNSSCVKDSDNDDQQLNSSSGTNTNNKTTASMHTTITDATLPFPVYRCVDGLWTILMKNPEVSVRDEFGIEEKLKLDYLKVYLKDVSRKNETTSNQKRTTSATTTKRRKRERHLTTREEHQNKKNYRR